MRNLHRIQPVKPTPGNFDFHAANDNGFHRIGAGNGGESASSHQVFFGEDSLAIVNSTSPLYTLSDTTCDMKICLL